MTSKQTVPDLHKDLREIGRDGERERERERERVSKRVNMCRGRGGNISWKGCTCCSVTGRTKMSQSNVQYPMHHHQQ